MRFRVRDEVRNGLNFKMKGGVRVMDGEQGCGERCAS